MKDMYRRLLLPGLVFQGVVIGGGYSTGREIAEFFAPSGPIGGILGLLVAALVWSAVMAVTFGLCVAARTFDYRTFFRMLLGPFGVAFELLLIVYLCLVLSVVGAAAGAVFGEMTGVSPVFGVAGLLVISGVLVYFGSSVVQRFIGFWSLLLYATFISLVVFSLMKFWPNISHEFSSASIGSRWAWDGIRYAGYNLACVPTVLFCLASIQDRDDAMTAGSLAGFIGIMPAVFLFVAMMAFFPEVADENVPSSFLLEQLGMPWFSILFKVALLGTLVQTGVGMIHAVNERIAHSYEVSGKKMPSYIRSGVAVALILGSGILASKFGLVNLIAKGYGILTYGFLLVFVIPVLTIGVRKLRRLPRTEVL